MSDPKRAGPDRTIILRIPRVDPLSLEIDLAAVRAGKTAPQFCKTVLADALSCAVPAPCPQPSARRAREARAA